MTYWTVVITTDQREAQSFAPVEATIVTSRSVSAPTGQGRTQYEIEVVYRYTVDGQTYTADTFRLGAMPTDSFWVNEQVRAFPSGSRRVAYVDPDDPTRAVLDNSFTLRDMFIPAVLSVFYGAIAVGIVGAIHIVRFVTGDLPPFAGAQLIRDAPEITRIRPHHSPPSFRAAGLGFLLLFGAVFLLFFVVIRFDDRASVFPITLGVIATIVLAKWVFLVWPWRHPAREITIDRRQGIIVAPASPDDPDPARIALADVTAVTAERRPNRVVAHLATPEPSRASTAELARFKSGKAELARNFADDLAELLGVSHAASE